MYKFFCLCKGYGNHSYLLSFLHDALPISSPAFRVARAIHRSVDGTGRVRPVACGPPDRSEEHTSELQSHSELVCRLLLEKKKKRCINEYFHRHQRAYLCDSCLCFRVLTWY